MFMVLFFLFLLQLKQKTFEFRKNLKSFLKVLGQLLLNIGSFTTQVNVFQDLLDIDLLIADSAELFLIIFFLIL